MVQMTCPDWFELVSAAADDQVLAGERARLDAHLASCSSCRALLQEFEQERRRRRMAPPVDHGDLMARVLEERAQVPPGHRAERQLARRGALALVAVVAVAVGFAATPGRDRSPATTTPLAQPEVLIDADGRSFDLADVEVAAGTTVEWRNTGSSTHHLVRRLGAAVVADDLEPGAIESATFSEPGTYEFFCTIHEGMTGTVTVGA
ncbi:MAG: cupredoxin domain-containing protein [Acidimicrobiales bacterium]